MSKVLHLAYLHPKDDSRIVKKELYTLFLEGHEVFYATSDSAPGKEPEWLNFIPLQGNNKSLLVNYFINSTLKKEFLSIVEEVRPDIVHIHEYGISYLVKLIRRRFPTIRVIYDIHEDNIHYSYEKDVKRYGKNLANVLVCLRGIKEHEACREADAIIPAVFFLKENLSKYAQRTMLLCNYPIIEGGILKPNLSKRGKCICYSGDIAPIRKIDLIIEACIKNKTKVDFAGYITENYFAELKDRYGDFYGINWEYVGVLNSEGLKAFYLEHKVGICLLEDTIQMRIAMPIKIFEYMSYGMPIVVSALPTVSGIINESGCGICVENEIDKISKVINELIKDSGRMQKMSDMGVEAVNRKYNWAFESKKLVSLYRELLSDG